MEEQVFVGTRETVINKAPVTGTIVEENGESFYKIENYDRMDPFLLSVVSSSNHWLFISSLGGLTAGRSNPDNALFPYVTDDLLHANSSFTGSKTIVKLLSDKGVQLWEPFSDRYEGLYSLSRNLYKNTESTRIMFEENNWDLGIRFRYGWTTSDKYGFIKFSEVTNVAAGEVTIEVLDGIQNILAAGVTQRTQLEFSTLLDGYKKNELIEANGLGIFSLSSQLTDRAQPSESLAATTVFANGTSVDNVLLSSTQLDKFRRNEPLQTETDVKGIKAAYLISATHTLAPGDGANWKLVAELQQNMRGISLLMKALEDENLGKLIDENIQQNTRHLRELVGKADGIQLTANKLETTRHFSNVLFNIMRGGVFDDGYMLDKNDFIAFVKIANPFVLDTHAEAIHTLPASVPRKEVVSLAEASKDPHFIKLAYEYLPLYLSRRHGDPSRPWNNFFIKVRDDAGGKLLSYQGNWRDIFQNWEALALSHPAFLESMIAKFLNNSTADGYNPYRIFREGFDWEELEPENPWANIGYWGDHQIIYLLKLLELLNACYPDKLHAFANKKIFSFANVPYRIKTYEEILSNPRDTIEFDASLNKQLRGEEQRYGSDAMYLKQADNTMLQVNLIEKLLITLLAKLSNFIPDGGIWMNTQRPEWNDANNALVGYGVSMVTLYYIRRYLSFLVEFVHKLNQDSYDVSVELHTFFESIAAPMIALEKSGVDEMTAAQRKQTVDALGKAASEYRSQIYGSGFSGSTGQIDAARLNEFLSAALALADATINRNKREDGLFNSYNLLVISDKGMEVNHLYEMLEGQVALLSSGFLSVDETLQVLRALRKSSLYRADQNSYILYPDKRLPLFIEKNQVKAESVYKSALLTKLLDDGNAEIIYKDADGKFHFQSGLDNAEALSNKLNALDSDPEYAPLLAKEKKLVLNLYEDTFNHAEFTGRANTFYKYEGLGSIYWHMVSKLLLAVYENFRHAEQVSENQDKLSELEQAFREIKAGIGVEKSPRDYGAIPTDPYSHTPSFAGVQQPGMTGQVKEDIISRFGELGINIESAKIVIRPSLLKSKELLSADEQFSYQDAAGEEQVIDCASGSLVFTLCQVPFIYKRSNADEIEVTLKDGSIVKMEGLEISEELSRSIFDRDGKVKRIEVLLKR